MISKVEPFVNLVRHSLSKHMRLINKSYIGDEFVN